MPNAFVHVELNTTDVPKAKEFYTSLFDWELEDVTGGGGIPYTIIKVGSGTGGGMMKHPMPGAPSMWLAYVHVNNVEAATQKAKSLGAKIIKEPTQVPGMGWFSIFVDPTGAPLALWQAQTAKS